MLGTIVFTCIGCVFTLNAALSLMLCAAVNVRTWSPGGPSPTLCGRECSTLVCLVWPLLTLVIPLALHNNLL